MSVILNVSSLRSRLSGCGEKRQLYDRRREVKIVGRCLKGKRWTVSARDDAGMVCVDTVAPIAAFPLGDIFAT